MIESSVMLPTQDKYIISNAIATSFQLFFFPWVIIEKFIQTSYC